MELYKIRLMRSCEAEPVFVKPAEGEPSMSVNALIDANGIIYPAQRSGDGVIALITGREGAELTLTPVDAPAAVKPCLLISEPDKLNIHVGGGYFTSYVLDPTLAKPYLGPVLNADGESYTRLDFNTREHPHHRSVFAGVGDVTLVGSETAKKVDFWNEPENRGYQRHMAVTELYSGAAFARISALLRWEAADGTPMLDEERTYTVYNQPASCRYIDVSMKFKASYGIVRFGPTKEAGPLGLRVADSMRVDNGDGIMTNSYGARGERECWGKSAQWCDYYGTINHAGEGKKYGITVFDSENNERYPTSWHIRDYGLFAPNNLYFKGGQVIPENESLTYRYRLIFREGELPPEKINEKFIWYLNGK